MSGGKDPFEYAPGWKPSPGDAVIGIVTALDKGHSAYGTYVIVTVEQEDGKGPVAVHAFHTALNNRLSEVRPTIGSKLAIKYEGEQIPKSGGDPYHKYLVRSNVQPADFWGDTTPPAPVAAPVVPTAASQESPPPANATTDDDIPF